MKPSLGSAIVGDEAIGVEVSLGRVDVRQAEVLNAAHAACLRCSRSSRSRGAALAGAGAALAVHAAAGVALVVISLLAAVERHGAAAHAVADGAHEVGRRVVT